MADSLSELEALGEAEAEAEVVVLAGVLEAGVELAPVAVAVAERVPLPTMLN